MNLARRTGMTARSLSQSRERHASFIFLLFDDGETRRLVQDEYAKLVGGELRLAARADHAVRVADWYVDARRAACPARQ